MDLIGTLLEPNELNYQNHSYCIYDQGEIHAPNSTALFAFTVLLLVVIAILLGVLEGILDVGVVGVNTGERSEKLLGRGER